MEFRHLAGATGLLSHAGVRILLDPWLDDGIFHGAWFHFPPAPISPLEVGPVDFVFISHIHEDHCSVGTLRHLDPRAELIVADRQPALVLDMLAREGIQFARVHLVPPMSPVEIRPGLIADVITADPAHELNYQIDNALVLVWDGRVIYDANDCPPYDAGLDYLRTTHGGVDLALLPYATGSSYPACYINLSHEEKLAERDRLRESGLDMFVETVRRLQPRWAAPFADQYVIAGSRSELNQYLPHPPGFGVVRDRLQAAGLGSAGVFLNPGQTFDIDSGARTPEDEFVVMDDTDRRNYIAALTGVRYDHERIELGRSVRLDRLVDAGRARLWAHQQRTGWFPPLAYVLEVPDRDEQFVVQLDRVDVERQRLGAPTAQPYLGIRMSATLLAMLLIGHVSWNIADAALFLDFDRRPNDYDPVVHANLNHLHI